jgi:hypothetical protein
MRPLETNERSFENVSTDALEIKGGARLKIFFGKVRKISAIVISSLFFKEIEEKYEQF